MSSNASTFIVRQETTHLLERKEDNCRILVYYPDKFSCNNGRKNVGNIEFTIKHSFVSAYKTLFEGDESA